MRLIRRFSTSSNSSSNSRLLDTFSALLRQSQTSTPKQTPTFPSSTLKNGFGKYNNELAPIPRLNPDSSPALLAEATPTYQPGDVYDHTRPFDPIPITSSTLHGKVKRKVDIFRANRYNLHRAHLNVELMASCVSATGKIMHREKTGLSAKSQRQIASAIKRARNMGLLPYMHPPHL